MAKTYFPRSPFLDQSGLISREWLQWLQNPQFLTLTVNNGVPGTALSPTGVTAGIYGSASRIVSFSVNSAGQLVGATDAPIAITSTQVSGLGSMAAQSASAVAITGGTVAASSGLGSNGMPPQGSYASGAPAPASGAGALAGAFDTAAHRDAVITLLNNIQAALIANGILT